MDFLTRLSQLLTDPIFWITTILCGLILGVFANYLTRVADQLIARVSDRRRHKLQAASDLIKQEAVRLMRHPDERFDIKLDLLFYRENETAWNLVALGLLTTCAAALDLRNIIPRQSTFVFALLLGCACLSLVQSQRYRKKALHAWDVLKIYADLKRDRQSRDETAAVQQ
jgi:hypothetical protein